MPNINHESSDSIYNILSYSILGGHKWFFTPENENAGFIHQS